MKKLIAIVLILATLFTVIACADNGKGDKKDTTPVKNRYSFSTKDYSLSEMERAARANGVTYGRYAAALECGRVAPPPRKDGKG